MHNHIFHLDRSQTKLVLIITAACFSLAVLGVGIAMYMTQQDHYNKPQHEVVATTSAPSTPVPVAISQPPSAATVAKSLYCTDFTDLGSAAGGAVIDSGSCFIDGRKYAIDTFASSDARDAWLKAAESLGVVPLWETANSVTYASVE